MICWFSERPLQVGGKYAIKHTTRSRDVPRARPALPPRRQLALTATRPSGTLQMNDMGRVSLRVTVPLFVDEYRRNRTTGIVHPHRRGHERDRRRRHDPRRLQSVRRPWPSSRGARTSSSTRARSRASSASPRPATRALTVWFTGLSGSGKSTVAVALEQQLVELGGPGLPARRRQPAPRPQRRPRLRRSRAATRTSAGPARSRCLFADAGVVAIVPLISPYRRRPRPRPGPSRGAADCASSRSSSTRRSSCASSATRRASTPRPAPARSPASPASTTPTRRPLDPDVVLTPGPTPAEAAAIVAELLGL